MKNKKDSRSNEEIFFSKSKLNAYKRKLEGLSQIAESMWKLSNDSSEFLDLQDRQKMVDSVELIAKANEYVSKAEKYQQELRLSNRKYHKYYDQKTHWTYFIMSFVRSVDNCKDKMIFKLKQRGNGDFSNGKRIDAIPNTEKLNPLEKGTFIYKAVNRETHYLFIHPEKQKRQKYRVIEKPNNIALISCV